MDRELRHSFRGGGTYIAQRLFTIDVEKISRWYFDRDVPSCHDN